MRQLKWKFLLVVFVVAWALYEMYPLTPRDLIQTFEKKAEIIDTNLTAIIQKAQQLAQNNPNREYQALLQAVGTNDLTRYFPNLLTEDERNLPLKDRNRIIIQKIQREAASRIKLGLDLQGGISFLVSIDTNRLATISDKQSALQQAVEVLRRRIDRFGVSEPIIQPVGQSRILIQLPGLSEADKEIAREQIQRAAYLEFRLVHPESAKLLEEGIIEPGYEVLTMRQRPGSKRPPERLLVAKDPLLTGKYVKHAFADIDPMSGRPIVRLEFNSEGARLFADITRKYQGQRLAIVLDGELYSAPVIREPILGGQAVISGDFTMKEAIELANVLQNPLEAPLRIEEERSVDPTLGRDSIRSGIWAAILGLLSVSVFMVFYYFFGGLVADLALFLNLVLIVGALCAFEATLTLPGIAGIVLTIGMAVDANVLIFERIREELKAGKSFRGALDAGYSKAFGTILDANVTTLIAGIILIFKGVGPVKGFGVTLTIGICASMFTALVVTRLIFDFMIQRGWLKRLRFQDWIGTPRIDFIQWGRVLFIFSWVLITAGWIWGVFFRGSDVLGVDFRGGDQLGLRFEQKVDVGAIRQAIEGAGLPVSRIQYQKELATGQETLTIITEFGQGKKVEEVLKQKFPKAGFTRISLDEVGPTITGEIQVAAAVSLLLVIFGILVYVAFRYEFSFAIGAILALVHDVLMSLSILYLVGGVVDSTIVAALLAILGYSVNDTIVVFDRIRENLKLGLRGTFREIMNYSINQTLSRTLITSGTTLLTDLCLYIFGGGAIKDFAFVLLVGIIAGTYSSIYIASLMVLWWHKGERPKMAAAPTGAPIPGTEPAKVSV